MPTCSSMSVTIWTIPSSSQTTRALRRSSRPSTTRSRTTTGSSAWYNDSLGEANWGLGLGLSSSGHWSPSTVALMLWRAKSMPMMKEDHLEKKSKNKSEIDSIKPSNTLIYRHHDCRKCFHFFTASFPFLLTCSFSQFMGSPSINYILLTS